MKNLCGKMRKPDNPYEVWATKDGGWEWQVLKKWQAVDSEMYARWFCLVKSPFIPEGEMGDCYAKEIMDNAVRIK